MIKRSISKRQSLSAVKLGRVSPPCEKQQSRQNNEVHLWLAHRTLLSLQLVRWSLLFLPIFPWQVRIPSQPQRARLTAFYGLWFINMVLYYCKSTGGEAQAEQALAGIIKKNWKAIWAVSYQLVQCVKHMH